ncbi:MAG TPA: ion channel, partial [Bacteroidia bacterium]|nr:ion channel [Bacteroidia bacterium]
MLSRLKHYRHILLPLYLIIATTIMGTFGYHFICHYPAVDAFYMTIITIATVGYGEVYPLDMTGRLFTAFLIIVSFGTFAYAVASLTRFVLDGEFNKLFKIRKLNATIEKM